MTERFDAVCIGAGIYGSAIAIHLAKRGRSCALVESESDILRRASRNNQARLHGGYHYPRSFLTAGRSQTLRTLFAERFPDAIVRDVASLYAVSRRGSLITARQFREFCRHIQAPLEPARALYRDWFTPEEVEEVFEVEEDSIDLDRVAAQLKTELVQNHVTLLTRHSASRIDQEGGELRVVLEDRTLHAKQVFVCTYSATPELLRLSSLQPLPLVHELAELVRVRVPEPLARVGITVVDGPFFSLLPRPGLGEHTLSHVRFTPHQRWEAGPVSSAGPSNFSLMQRDAVRFVPLLAELKRTDSIWETKTFPNISQDENDSRPVLYSRNHGLRGLHVILGSKIGHIFDIVDTIGGDVAP